jgi:hypothetical protein
MPDFTAENLRGSTQVTLYLDRVTQSSLDDLCESICDLLVSSGFNSDDGVDAILIVRAKPFPALMRDRAIKRLVRRSARILVPGRSREQ